MTDTKKTIVTALKGLLPQKSFKEITVNEIYEKARVSKDAFYNCFKTKYELLEYYLKDLSAAANVIIRSCTRTQAEQKFRKILKDNLALIHNLFAGSSHKSLNLLLKFLAFDLELSSAGKAEDVIGREFFRKDFMAGGFFNAVWPLIEKEWEISETDIDNFVSYIYKMLIYIRVWEFSTNSDE